MTAMVLQAELQIATDAQVPKKAQFQDWLNTCFADAADATVLIRLVDETESAALNLQYRDKPGPTNVLSFPFEAPPEVPMEHLGDLVICAPVIAAEAEMQQKNPQDHWAHMLIHGVLHLQGYDHRTDAEAEVMESLEVRLLAKLGISDPYL